MGHRPMYCNTLDRDDCTHVYSMVRSGIPILHRYGLEDVFYKYGVDVEFWAHEHNYQRFFPLYNRQTSVYVQVYNGSIEHPYTNPRAPIHIISGSAGCQEDTDKFKLRKDPWIAFRSSDYGYARMTVYNATHLHLQQVSDDKVSTFYPEHITLIIKDT
ncbi:ACP7 [Cordylochernes scorpioides]|uniref:ACP7 n=1 Tax=Cordylochernes scorpioides TaxID=51811 RepID=A0ABY6L371_9ARAC|nr:ACP7 [Cordylochernes scorpioides]